jgi:hypothetical protein
MHQNRYQYDDKEGGEGYLAGTNNDSIAALTAAFELPDAGG